jgi:hypothetical protein
MEQMQEIIQPITNKLFGSAGVCIILLGCPICASGCFKAYGLSSNEEGSENRVIDLRDKDEMNEMTNLTN